MKNTIKLLSLLKDALIEHKNEKLSLDRYFGRIDCLKFLNNNVLEDNYHNYGKSACVAGFGSLHKPLVDWYIERTGEKDCIYLDDICGSILAPENDGFFTEPDSNLILGSLTSDEGIERKFFIKGVSLLSKDEIESIRYLNKEEPTIKDAIKYIDILIDRLRERI